MEMKPWHRFYDYNVPLTFRKPRMPIFDILQYAANAYPDKAAVQFLGFKRR